MLQLTVAQNPQKETNAAVE